MPIYFLWGEEEFALEQEVNKIKKTVLKAEISPLNYKRLDNPDFSTFDEALRSQPMMFGDILYLIKCQRYFLESAKKYKLDDKQIADLIKSLENVSDRVHIILTCPIERGERKKPDSRKKLYKAVAKLTKIKEFPAYKPYEEYKIAPWVKNAAKEKGLDITNDVISLLIQTTGPSLRDLNSQLEKMKLAAYPENKITTKLVEDICITNQDIFILSDLILLKRYDDTLLEISKLLQKSHFLEILAFLQTTFLKLLQTKVYSKNMGGFELAKKLGQNEYVVKKNLEKLANVQLKELLRIKINLTDAEFKIKSGACEPMAALEAAILGG